MGKIAALAVTAVLCGAVLRRGAPEFSLLLALCAGAALLFLALEAVDGALEAARRIAAMAMLEDALLRPVAKTVALSMVTRVTGELCRAAGEGGVAAFVETAGTLLALGAALPLAEGVLELMAQLLS